MKWQHVFDPLSSTGNLPQLDKHDWHLLASPLGVWLTTGLFADLRYEELMRNILVTVNWLNVKTFTPAQRQVGGMLDPLVSHLKIGIAPVRVGTVASATVSVGTVRFELSGWLYSL